VSSIIHRIQLLVRRIVGFFVDDGINALLTIMWIGIVLVIARVMPGQAWEGALLAGGLSVLFVISIILRVHRTRQRVPAETTSQQKL
jgi:uncharacterized membrane protein (UPF0136 family)